MADEQDSDVLHEKAESDDSDLLTVKEAASFLRILRRDGSPCEERVRNLVNAKKLPYYKPFGRLLFRRTELNHLVEASKNGGKKWR